ncbi:MAG: hypothetical protein JXA73_04830 [Acidobacteria bacterium]|nr:hypothetical protein [Acidobacteriota bacterium]
MPDDSKVMRWGLIFAALVLVVRIVLEQAGAPEKVNLIFGVAWLYFILPALFALGIRARNDVHLFKSLLKDVVLFALCTRVMVMITCMLAYIFRWEQSHYYPGGNVGENVGAWTGLVIIPVRNLVIWVVMATIVGMIVGSITLLLKRKQTIPSSSRL